MPHMPGKTTEKTSVPASAVDMYSGRAIVHGHAVIRVELDDEGKAVDWTYMEANEELALMDGKPLEELIGHRYYEIFPEGDRKWLDIFYRAAWKGESVAVDDIAEEIGLYLHVEAYPVGKEEIGRAHV